MNIFTEDAIAEVKRIRRNVKQCQSICNAKKDASELDKKMVETLEMIAETTVMLLQDAFRIDDLDCE